jgi:tRNA 2-selenouridine synthase
MSLLKDLFINNTPLLDLRAPIEFVQGAFPNATNLPLLTNKEREQVGTCYKQQGQEKAIQLGHQIVSGEVKAQRISAWKKYFQENPDAYLYCFRGGMRSHLVQQWLKDEGVEVPLIEGGYKALRRYLMAILEQPVNLLRISGETGVGKTDLLIEMPHHIDLEGLANHRGSAFGKNVSQQPRQIDFENQLAIQLLKNTGHCNIVEDESHYIGQITIPLIFMQMMRESQVVILTCPLEQRVERIYDDYVVKQKSAFILENPEQGKQQFNDFLLSALEKIQKRLGGLRYQQLNTIMQQALKENSESLHKQWISDLLEFYYDPMYHYQIDKKKELIIFSGDKTEVKEFLTLNFSATTDKK